MGSNAIVVIAVVALLFAGMSLLFRRTCNGNSYHSDSGIYGATSQTHHHHHNGTGNGHHHSTMGGHHGGGFHDGGGGGHH